MKKKLNYLLIIAILCFGAVTVSSCRGKSASKAMEVIKGVGRHGDDVYRTYKNYDD